MGRGRGWTERHTGGGGLVSAREASSFFGLPIMIDALGDRLH